MSKQLTQKAVLAAVAKSELGTRELAARAGVSRGSLWRWKTGRQNPRPEHVQALAGALGLIPTDPPRKARKKSVNAASKAAASNRPKAGARKTKTTAQKAARKSTASKAPAKKAAARKSAAPTKPARKVAVRKDAGTKVTVTKKATSTATPAKKTAPRKRTAPKAAATPAKTPAVVAPAEELTLQLVDLVPKPLGGYAAKMCATLASNDNDTNYDPAMKDEIPAFFRALMEDGNVFEQQMAVEFMKALGGFDATRPNILRITDGPGTFDEKVATVAKVLKGKKYIFVPDNERDANGERTLESKIRREVITMAAMAAGALFIWNCRFPADLVNSRIAEPDFLVRDGMNANGNWAYLPGDVKHHKSLTGSGAVREWMVSEMSDPSIHSTSYAVLGEGPPKLEDSMQLSHYYRDLQRLGHAADGYAVWGAILGKENVLVWRDLREEYHIHRDAHGVRRKMSALDIYDFEFAHRVDVVANAMSRSQNPSIERIAPPEYKTECESCVWRTVCKDEMHESDHITLLPGITPDRAQAHYEQGVRTVAGLARLDHHTALLVDAKLSAPMILEEAQRLARIDPNGSIIQLFGNRRVEQELIETYVAAGITTVGQVAKFDRKTAAYADTGVFRLAESIDQARVAKAQKVHLRRGVEFVDLPKALVELDVDMENDDLIEMWGTQLSVNGRVAGLGFKPGYYPFASFDGTDDGEAQAFVQFWAFLHNLIEVSNGNFRAYYYTAAENRCMRHLVTKHAGYPGMPTEEELEAFIESEHWVDMYPILTEQLFWPTENKSLKSFAKWTRFTWRDTDPSGAASVLWYRDAVSHPDEAVREENRQRLLDYNEDDVNATLWIRTWIRRLGAGRRPGEKLPNVAELDRRFRGSKAFAA